MHDDAIEERQVLWQDVHDDGRCTVHHLSECTPESLHGDVHTSTSKRHLVDELLARRTFACIVRHAAQFLAAKCVGVRADTRARLRVEPRQNTAP